MISALIPTRSNLKKLLPPNYRSILCAKFNNVYSESHIYKVIAGHRNNMLILNAAIDLARETKQEHDLINEQITNLSQ